MSVFTILFTYIFPLVAICYFLLKRRFNYWKNRGVFSTNPNTIMGDLVDIGRKYHIAHKIQTLYNNFKAHRFGGMFTLITPILMITDLELLKHILVKDFNSFTDRNFYNNEVDDPLSVSLLTLEGERWKRRRNLLSPIFTSGKLKNMFKIMMEKSDELLRCGDENINTGISVETKRLAQNYTMKSIGSCAFGIDLETGTDQMEKLKQVVFGGRNPFGFVLFLIKANFPNFARRLKMRLTDKHVEQFVLEMITANTKFREETGFRRDDLLDLLMDIKREQKIDIEEFDFMRLAAESLLFFLGGFETSASTMSWAIFEIARNEACQDRLRNEIRQSKANNGGALTYESIAEMEYLNQVFYETLRLYPPFTTNFRKATTDYKIPGSDIVLEKGTTVWIPSFAIQRDPEYYTNPDDFNPENFSKESTKKRDPYTFLAFGNGPRNCIGQRFAELQSKIGIAVIVENFRISVNQKTIMPVTFDLSQPVSPAAKGGLWIDFERV